MVKSPAQVEEERKVPLMFDITYVPGYIIALQVMCALFPDKVKRAQRPELEIFEISADQIDIDQLPYPESVKEELRAGAKFWLMYRRK